MKKEDSNPADDVKLQALLRASRMSPSLPPRFQENVWRRIEDAEAPAANAVSWLDALAALILRPRFALAAVAMLMLAGILWGTHEGSRAARQDAEARYVAVVAPDTLH
jgi:hypothetical protein